MTSQSNTWMTIREAALALAVSELTVRRRIKEGRVPHRLVAGKYYVDVDALRRRAAGPAVPLRLRHTDQTADHSDESSDESATDQVIDHGKGEGVTADVPGGLDLNALMLEHARLAEAAGRARLLEEQLRELQDRYTMLQEGSLALATRNGWLESKLEERESDLKLLTDRRHNKRPWWKRMFSNPQADS